MQDVHAPVMFLDRTYYEALALAIEARDYLAHAARGDRQELDLLADLTFSLEATRLTATVTQVMAWLLAQKAVFAGDLSADEAARPPLRLGGHAVCLFEGEGARALPDGIRRLSARARRLYVRVQRLDQMVAEAGERNAPVRPFSHPGPRSAG
jgi:regulator of CtrA degradation